MSRWFEKMSSTITVKNSNSKPKVWCCVAFMSLIKTPEQVDNDAAWNDLKSCMTLVGCLLAVLGRALLKVGKATIVHHSVMPLISADDVQLPIFSVLGEVHCCVGIPTDVHSAFPLPCPQ